MPGQLSAVQWHTAKQKHGFSTAEVWGQTNEMAVKELDQAALLHVCADHSSEATITTIEEEVLIYLSES